MNGACKHCGKPIVRRGSRKPVFCSLDCKGEWQKTQKPISKERLAELYVDQGLSTYQIAGLVGRNPKRVYEWLIGYGIQPRPRAWDTSPGNQPFHNKSWLEQEYLSNKRSASEIASECNVTESNILFFLRKHGIRSRSMDTIRAMKYWGARGEQNPMFGKRGNKNPHWKGGVTPERQAFYLSDEWKAASVAVWRRDHATCQRCGLKMGPGVELHIHHIVSFACRQLRAEPSNLVLLCNLCHDWVHSRKNKQKEWVKEDIPSD